MYVSAAYLSNLVGAWWTRLAQKVRSRGDDIHVVVVVELALRINFESILTRMHLPYDGRKNSADFLSACPIEFI